MRLLLDEMLSPLLAEQLRDRGHDVQAVKGSEHEQLSDPQVLNLGRAEHRAVVTNNLVDFRPLHEEAVTPGGAGHWGMVFMPGNYRRTKAGTGLILAALEAKLAEFPEEDSLLNGETWL